MQESVVTVIVLAATWVVLARYAPPAIRRAMRSTLARLLHKAGLGSLARRLEARAEDGACGSGCGTCGSCGNDESQRNEFSISADALKRSTRR